MLATAILASAGIAGCGGDDDAANQTVAESSGTSTADDATSDDTTSSSGSDGAAGGTAVEIVDFIYEPEEITVAAGETVVWNNQDDAAHTATADDRSFDTDTISGGDSGKLTFDEPGEYAYFCVFHPFMKGTVVVE